MSRWICVVLCVLALRDTPSLHAETKGDSLRLTLPPTIYAAPGVEMNIYYDNIVLTETPEAYRFVVKCKIGKSEERRWTVTPNRGNVGEIPFSIKVTDSKGKTLDEAKTTLRIVRPDAGAGKSIRLLVVGDSLTAAGMYPAEIAKLLSQPGNPAWRMLGTREVAAQKGAAHEGYGGWTWSRFATHYEPNPNLAEKKFSSPFVFLGKTGEPELDLPRYFKTSCNDERPDIVTFLLGINDCFGANPEDQKAMDATIDTMFTNAETLLAAFRKALPKAELGVCLTPPPNSRESGFQANYQGKYHRWGWKRIQHRLVERQIEHFGGREKERIFFIPTELNLDPVDGYPDNNGVHPNAAGYQQIGASIYAWIKWRLQGGRKGADCAGTGAQAE